MNFPHTDCVICIIYNGDRGEILKIRKKDPPGLERNNYLIFIFSVRLLLNEKLKFNLGKSPRRNNSNSVACVAKNSCRNASSGEGKKEEEG